MDLICLDLSKAFDTVSNGKLMATVEKMSINTLIVKCIKIWLNRDSVYAGRGIIRWVRVYLLCSSGISLGMTLERTVLIKFVDDTSGGIASAERIRQLCEVEQ